MNSAGHMEFGGIWQRTENQGLKISQLKFSISCVLLLLALLPSCKSLAVTPRMRIANPLQDAGVVVLDAASPEFMVEVQKLLSPDAVIKASSFLPQSLVLVNNTQQFIWGFTAVYRYPDWISPAGTSWKHRISPSAGGPADRNRMLAPGARFLVTPVSDFLASSDLNGNVIAQPYLDEGMDRMIAQFKRQHSNPNERVDVTIDSVIFEDGSLAGPDTESMMEKINQRIRAEKDLAKSLQTLSGEGLRAKLLFHAHKGMGDEYSGRTSSVAQSLLSVLDQHGEGAAQQILEQMRGRMWFVNSGNVRRK